MANPKGKKPTRTAGRRASAPVSISLTQAERMLPLVSHIGNEIRDRWLQLAQLEREQSDLDRRRHTLDWPSRSRRYQITDEINGQRARLQDAVGELETLQALLVDPVQGEIAFPTLVQNKRAYWVWTLGDTQIEWWCFANEPHRRAVPPSWRKRRDAAAKGSKELPFVEDDEEAPF